jgi:hypothetical protein
MSMIQQTSIPEMIAQSKDIISNPSVGTFERYEQRGTMVNAAIYVGIAAILAGILGIRFDHILGSVIGSALSALIGFFVFTGMVFYIGRSTAGGTGTWDEVAYTFSLFIAPLIVIGAVISLVSFIPILGPFVVAIVSLLILLVQAYFAYIAVQSSMNIRDQGKAITTLLLAVVGTFIAQMLIGIIL